MANEEGRDLESNNIYPGTSESRPEELQTVGYGDFCCIPLCKNSTLDKNKSKSGIGLFSFPSDPSV